MVSLMAWHKSTVSSETPGKAGSFPSSIGKRIRTCLKVTQPPDVDHKTRVLGQLWEWLGDGCPQDDLSSPTFLPGLTLQHPWVLTWRGLFPVPAWSTKHSHVSSWSDMTS